MRHIAGRCHCGNITFDFDLPDPGLQIPVRTCSCSFCRKHGGAWTSHPEGRLVARLAEPGEVNRYRFGHETADFYICKRCGTVPFVVSTVDGRPHAVVNAHTFENIAGEALTASATDFDGESVEARLSRRHRNWISDVTLET